jgi:hypothetical protein
VGSLRLSRRDSAAVLAAGGERTGAWVIVAGDYANEGEPDVWIEVTAELPRETSPASSSRPYRTSTPDSPPGRLSTRCTPMTTKQSQQTIINVGLTTTVLAERFRTRCADLPKQAQVAWWQRTAYAWICSHPSCNDRAGVNYKTKRGARRGADSHAAEHRGAAVKEIADASDH